MGQVIQFISKGAPMTNSGPCCFGRIRHGQSSTSKAHTTHKRRDDELLRRENQLWQRMELLLDREAELREQELASANRREAHLQSQVDMLLSILSNNQSDKSLPPGSVGSVSESQGQPPPRIADVLQTMEQSAANLSHGTFTEDYGGTDALSAIDNALHEGPVRQEGPASTPPSQPNTTPPTQPSFAQELKGVVDGVLTGKVDALEDMQWENLRVPKRQGGSQASTGQATGAPSSSSSSPPAPTTPTQPSTASARGGAAPMSIADAMMSAAAAAAEAGDGPVEVEKAPKDGPPPQLNVGDDDIYWVAALHVRFPLHTTACTAPSGSRWCLPPGLRLTGMHVFSRTRLSRSRFTTHLHAPCVRALMSACIQSRTCSCNLPATDSSRAPPIPSMLCLVKLQHTADLAERVPAPQHPTHWLPVHRFLQSHL